METLLFPIKRTTISLSKNLMFACLGPYLAALSFGYMIGYSSPAIPAMINDFIITEEDGYTFGALGTLGGAIGCPLAGWMMETLGRKKTLLFLCAPYLLGWILITTESISMLYLGRILTGLSSGMVTVVSTVYIAETVPKEMRGMLASGVQLSITIGILLVYTLGMFLDWKSLALIGAGIPIVAAILILKIPDTPRFHLLRGDRPGALKALSWLMGKAEVEKEIRDIEEILPDPSDKITWTEFLQPQLLRPLQISLGLMMFQHLTGINVVMFYTVTIFEKAGLEGNGEIATVIVGLAQVVSTLLACVLVDRVGRPKLLTVAGAGMAISCFCMAYCFSQSAPGPFSLFCLVSYVIAFSLGWGPVPNLIMSEVFPVQARGTANAMASIACWASSFLVTSSYGTMCAVVGQSGAFALFGLVCVVSVIFVLDMVPETKGKSLEDIELYFLEGS